jgi:pyruvate carboxylase
MKSIKKLLVANRSEIAIRVFRSATELGIPTVAIYSHEDRFALHRFKADEAYEIGKPGEPISAYLDIDPIIRLACEIGADAIHPGYGFLSEKPAFAKACANAGIKFVGPTVDSLEKLGDKTAAREIAEVVGVPVLGGGKGSLTSGEEALEQAEKLTYPVILKAAHGGGGRGMRVVHQADKLVAEWEQAKRESLSAFGSDEIFLEKFLVRARHIEVQLLGDEHGNLIHLYERDCSVQRRHQKVAEIAPAPNLDPTIREKLCDAAVRIGRHVGYQNAGTVEFLLDAESSQYFFIEVNPRIQVEHTVTEEVTGVDIVKSQLLIAAGVSLADPRIDLPNQESVRLHGFALQCRVTTEDPANDFLPDYGRLTHYRSASGMGIRLDGGSAFSGAIVNPYYDSMLVKVTASARKFPETVRKMLRSLQEFRIRGVKSNIPFLINLVQHPSFVLGECTTRFIDETPELFNLPRRRDRATRLLSYIGETIVNGNSLVEGRPVATRRLPAPVPRLADNVGRTRGSRDVFLELGAEKFSKWILDQKPLLLTDTTFRDAHQSLLATRFRTKDLLDIAEVYSHLCPQLFSIEMWGGATFDTTMRFLKESPWERLTQMRERVPNTLFQMLLRASNAVGYTNYPDSVVREFVREAADAGIDVFRVFDALNWTENMQVAMEAVVESGAICEAAICYSGDIQNPNRTKYNLRYYVDLAKQLEKMGAHVLAIKDMAGLCKPFATATLVKALKQEIGIPIHFHTHDTAGTQIAAILSGAGEQLDIADAAMAPLSGGTSQPNLNTLNEALRFTERETGLDSQNLDQIAEYWRVARQFYKPFESEVLPGTADLYNHEMPGGQYTNLYQQAHALGLADQWSGICRAYADVNQLFGDIVKVTPTSKAVGDMALFMVANKLTNADVLNPEKELAFPASVIDLIGGAMGQPTGGFPEEVKKQILRDGPAYEGRPGATMPDADFEGATAKVEELLGRVPHRREVISYLLYPKVYADFAKHQRVFSDTSALPTPVFFYGMLPGEEIAVDIELGKTLIIKYLAVGTPHADGSRSVFFELNGQPRDISVVDQSEESDVVKAAKAEPDNPAHVGASMPGMIVTVAVQEGDPVKKGQKLLSVEAMKMETTIYAELDGKIGTVYVQSGSQVATGDLLLTVEP